MKRQQEQPEDSCIELPSEIWYTIFALLGEEWYLREAVGVCHSWASIVRDQVNHIGNDRRTYILSDTMLQRVPNLRILETRTPYFPVTDRGFDSLTALTRLNISIVRHNISPHALTALVNLKSLSCAYSLYLPRATNLTALNLRQNNNVTDADIKRFVCLESLAIWGCHKLSVHAIGQLTTLRRFETRETSWSEPSVHHLTNLTNLRTLIVNSPGWVPDSVISRLSGLTNLELTNLHGPFTGSCFPSLTALTNLHFHRANYLNAYFSLPKSLQTLNLNAQTRHWLTADTEQFPALTTLVLHGSLHMGRERLALLPSLRHLDVSSLMHDTPLTQLTSLVVDGRRSCLHNK